MITMICEKTGLPFEAENRRRKSHPTVMWWLAKAAEEGWYGEANTALYGNKTYGIEKQKFTSIEQFVAYFEQLRETALQAKNDRITAEVQRKREIQEAKRQRYIMNDFLNANGYHWQKWENDEEDIDLLRMPVYEWILRSPDDRVVTVREAMQELAYAGKDFAKTWLAERGIAEEMPAIEKKRQKEAAKAQAIEDVPMTQERQEYIAEAIPALLEAGLSQEQAEAEAKRLSLPHTPQEDDVYLMPVQLPHTAALVINSDFRYGVRIGGRWHGIEEIIEQYPGSAQQLALYAERNRRA